MGLVVTHSGFDPKFLMVRIGNESTRLAHDVQVQAVAAIRTESPRRTQAITDPGIIPNWLEKANVTSTPAATKIEMGHLEPLDMDKSAPANTIRDFIADNYAKKSSGGKRHVFPHAWWFLSTNQKLQLEMARKSGAYGGPQPPPMFLGAINAGRVPVHPRMSSEVGYYARQVGFLDRIRANVEAYWKARVTMVRL